MHRQRLQDTILALELLAPTIVQHEVGLAHWRVEHMELEGNFLDMDLWRTDGPCGTAACLIGWAAPELAHHGLQLKPLTVGGPPRPYFKHKSDYSALVEFYQIDEYDIDQLFGPSNPNDIMTGIERLRNYLEQGDTE